MYECSNMATQCDECLQQRVEYSCGFCHQESSSKRSCMLEKHCRRPKSRWIYTGQPCPNPQIVSVSPMNATFTSATNLTIKGLNLGRMKGDITVAFVSEDGYQRFPCYIASYTNSRQLECSFSDLERSLDRSLEPPLRGNILVNVSQSQEYQATLPNFLFMEPQLDYLFPKMGPYQGGTLVTLRGSKLMIGNRREVSFGSFPCRVIK
ncbi:hypothetical protein Ciccas_001249 [Cichlidogyrus casuarinus]|uniref:Uncharacterized protein n=1 Tax=Cichlidogyrus casuarinus TaxID=1844966 RepID=A0ABD2QKU0_9PLAT